MARRITLTFVDGEVKVIALSPVIEVIIVFATIGLCWWGLYHLMIWAPLAISFIVAIAAARKIWGSGDDESEVKR